jgi:uncharacterized protein (TIGR03437 family)
VSNFAGNGGRGYSGDGSAATDAQLNNPVGLGLDSGGVLFFADQLNSRVRKVGTDGVINLVAGKGDKGYFGDTGAATSAGLSYPRGVAVDKSGNIYISDSPNHAIRKVSGGNITTFAGGSTAGPGFTGDGDKAVNARLNEPTGIAINAAGDVYFSDSLNNRIRKIDTNGVINTVAGNSQVGLVGDGGPALAARVTAPEALAFDAAGNLYIADAGNHAIRKMTTNGIMTTIAGTGEAGYSGDGGPATLAKLNNPKGVAVDSDGVVYIADTFNNRIRAISPNGVITTIAGSGYIGDAGDGGTGSQAIFRFPASVTVDSAKRLIIADTQNNRLRTLTPIRPPAPTGPPVIGAGALGTANAYGGFVGAAAPGSWIEIYGGNFAGGTRTWTAPDFNGAKAPTSLDGTRVTIGGKAAYVSFISTGQLNAQVPADVGLGPQQVNVLTSAGTSAPAQITITASKPGLLSPAQFRIGGRQFVTALLSDGRTYALTPAAIPGIPSRPARPGETITLFGIGFGDVNPGPVAGEISPGPSSLVLPLQIKFGDVTATVSYAGLAPGFVGLYQFNVVVPQVAGDAVPVTFTLGGEAGTQTLVIPVRQ